MAGGGPDGGALVPAGWGAAATAVREVRHGERHAERHAEWHAERKELEMVAWRSADWGPGVHFAPDGSGDTGSGEHTEHSEHVQPARRSHPDDADTGTAGRPR